MAKRGLNRAALTPSQRCITVARSTGLRCTNPKALGLEYCSTHMRNNKKVNEAKHLKAVMEQEVEKQLSRMQRFVTPIPAGDPEARGDVALVTELRRTVQRIRIFDEWIQELAEGDIGWGRTMFEKTTSSESGMDGDFVVDKTSENNVKRFEARANILYEMQMRERQHLVNVAKVWITAGFKAKELDLQERQIMAFNSAQMEILVALGHDPTNPAVRGIVHRAMMGLIPKENQAIER